MEVSGQHQAPSISHPGKETLLPNEHKFGGPHSWSAHSGDENISCTCQDSNPESSSLYPTSYCDYDILYIICSFQKLPSLHMYG